MVTDPPLDHERDDEECADPGQRRPHHHVLPYPLPVAPLEVLRWLHRVMPCDGDGDGGACVTGDSSAPRGRSLLGRE